MDGSQRFVQDELDGEESDEDQNGFEQLPDDGISRVNVRFPDIDDDDANTRGDKAHSYGIASDYTIIS